jgi:hypothetical protein
MYDAVLLAAGDVSAALVLTAFLIYNQGNGKINTGTWLILALSDSVDFLSYFQMTGEDWLKNAIPVSFAIGSVVTFVIALGRRRFSWPDTHDWIVIGLDTLITLWWFVSSDETAANLLYQATTVLAFLPMYRGLRKGKEKETFLPWVLWTGAYCIFISTAAFNLARWEEMVYPIVGMLTHGIVIWFVLKDKKAWRV